MTVKFTDEARDLIHKLSLTIMKYPLFVNYINETIKSKTTEISPIEISLTYEVLLFHQKNQDCRDISYDTIEYNDVIRAMNIILIKIIQNSLNTVIKDDNNYREDYTHVIHIIENVCDAGEYNSFIILMIVRNFIQNRNNLPLEHSIYKNMKTSYTQNSLTSRELNVIFKYFKSNNIDYVNFLLNTLCQYNNDINTIKENEMTLDDFNTFVTSAWFTLFNDYNTYTSPESRKILDKQILLDWSGEGDYVI